MEAVELKGGASAAETLFITRCSLMIMAWRDREG